jgi:hypothetical protein
MHQKLCCNAKKVFALVLQCTYIGGTLKGDAPMNTFEDAQKFGKEGFDAMVASATVVAKNYQTIAKEMADFAAKTVEHNKATFEKASSARSFERVAEVQQGYAKEAYEAFVAQSTKMGDLYKAAAAEAMKPFEKSFAAFGVKTPAAQ